MLIFAAEKYPIYVREYSKNIFSLQRYEDYFEPQNKKPIKYRYGTKTRSH